MNPKNLKNTFIFGGLMWFLILACIFALSSLACAQPATKRIVPEFGMTPVPTPPPLRVRVVAVESLNIRAEPSEESAADKYGLKSGDIRRVYLSCTGGEIREWVSINADCTRWVNSSYLEVVK